MIQSTEQHPEYNMVGIDDSKEYTSVTFSPDDDFRQFGQECKNLVQPPVKWILPDKRYALANASFLPDEVVKDHSKERMDRITKLEAMVEQLRLNQEIAAMPKKERKRAYIQEDKSYTIKQRLRKKLDQKLEDKENFIS